MKLFNKRKAVGIAGPTESGPTVPKLMNVHPSPKNKLPIILSKNQPQPRPSLLASFRRASMSSEEQNESLMSLGQSLFDLSTNHLNLQRGHQPGEWTTDNLQESVLSLLEKPVDEAVNILMSLLGNERAKEASMKFMASGSFNTNVNDELAKRVEELTKQNEQLLSTCQTLKEENTDTKTKLEDTLCMLSQVQVGNRASSSNMASLKEENEKLQDTIKEAGKLMMEMRSLVIASEEHADKLSEENRVLKASQEDKEQQLQEMKEEIKRLHSEQEQALLQRETDPNQGARLAELIKTNESLTEELEGKNEMVQAVQWALRKLKDEQSTIKETIVELRTENGNLRESATQKNKLGLKYLRENSSLREENTTLSARLSEETEKTEAVRVANEGLAARICKLVSFIQENRKGDATVTTTVTSSITSVNRNGSDSKKRSKGPAEIPLEQKLIQESLHELESSMNVLNGLGLSTRVLF